ALDTHFLMADRNGLLHMLGDDVLAQPRPARGAPLHAYAHLLLGARHRVVGHIRGLPRGGPATLRLTGFARHPGGTARTFGGLAPGFSGTTRGLGGPGGTFGGPGLRPRLVPGHAVVVVQPLLLRDRQVPSGLDIDTGRVLDLALGEGDLEVVLDQSRI